MFSADGDMIKRCVTCGSTSHVHKDCKRAGGSADPQKDAHWAAYKERKAAQPQPAEGPGGKAKGKGGKNKGKDNSGGKGAAAAAAAPPPEPQVQAQSAPPPVAQASVAKGKVFRKGWFSI